ERHGVFVDYNQNARDHTTASAYSVRPTPEARVSAPLTWDEVPACDPAAFTMDTLPRRFALLRDPGEGIDAAARSLEPLRAPAARPAQAGADEPASRPARPGAVPPPAPGKDVGPTGRRRTTAPLIEIARAATQKEALDGLERWRARHTEIWPRLEPNDI